MLELSAVDFKLTMINMFKKLGNKMENYNRGQEAVKKKIKIVEMKNIVAEIKN